MMVIVHPLSDPDICPKVHLRTLFGRQSDPAGFFRCLMLVSSLDLAQVCFRHAEFVEAPDDKLGHCGVYTPKLQSPQRWLEPVAKSSHRKAWPELKKPKIKTLLVALVAIVTVVILMVSVALAVFRDGFFDLYMKRLDAWVSAGGDVKTVESQVLETCGKLILTLAGAFERIQLLTFYRDEFDFRVDVCLKVTANRLYKQPKFDQPEMVTMICDDPRPYHELFKRLCQRRGLR